MTATIVNFCTNESRYLRACLEQALKFSQQVIVSVCDHFFDGSAENQKLLDQIYSAFPECFFVEYPFIPKKIPKSIFKKIEPAHFWHSLSRFVATKFLDPDVETVLFLDADEIPEGEKMREWLSEGKMHSHSVLKLANYWYFREPEYQALQWEDSPVILQKKALCTEALLHTKERQALYDLLPKPKERMVTGLDDAPMIHHYSWVRTEEEMLKKVRAWGHHADRDWEKLVKEEFSRPFLGVDFVHGYCYRNVTCPFQMDFLPFISKGSPNLKRLDTHQLLKLLSKKPLIFSNLLEMMRE